MIIRFLNLDMEGIDSSLSPYTNTEFCGCSEEGNLSVTSALCEITKDLPDFAAVRASTVHGHGKDFCPQEL
jgi:hypothetical protein